MNKTSATVFAFRVCSLALSHCHREASSGRRHTARPSEHRIRAHWRNGKSGKCAGMRANSTARTKKRKCTAIHARARPRARKRGPFRGVVLTRNITTCWGLGLLFGSLRTLRELAYQNAKQHRDIVPLSEGSVRPDGHQRQAGYHGVYRDGDARIVWIRKWPPLSCS